MRFGLALGLLGALLLSACPEAQDGGVDDGGARADGGRPSRYQVLRPAQPGAANLFALWVAGPDQLIAVGSRGTLLSARPAAEAPMGSAEPPPLTFSPMEAPADLPRVNGEPADLTDISGTSPTEVYAVGLGGTLLRFDGTTWRREQVAKVKDTDPPFTANLWGVYAHAGGAVAVGQGGVWLRRAAGAAPTQWQRSTVQPVLPVEGLFAAYGTRPDNLYAAGSTGSIYRWNGQAGSGWSGASPDGFTTKLGGLFGRGEDVYALGLSGALLRRSGDRFVDYGVRADTRCGDPMPRAYLRHGAVTPAGQLIVVGWEGVILRLREAPCGDGGAAVLTVRNESGPTPARLEAVALHKSNRTGDPKADMVTVYVAGAEGLVLRGEWSEP